MPGLQAARTGGPRRVRDSSSQKRREFFKFFESLWNRVDGFFVRIEYCDCHCAGVFGPGLESILLTRTMQSIPCYRVKFVPASFL